MKNLDYFYYFILFIMVDVQQSASQHELVDVKQNSQLQELLRSEGITVRKSAKTLARTPSSDELGQEVISYVKKSKPDFEKMRTEGYDDEVYEVEDGFIVVESRSTITDDRVISRNPTPLGNVDGKEFYNDWTQPRDTWLENYGVEPSAEFAPYKKTATNQVLKIDGRVMKILCGDSDASSATIAVDWSLDGQEVYKGGYLADAGYGLEQGEFDKTYEVIEKADLEEDVEAIKEKLLMFWENN